jgi:hypothetical protein
MSLREDLNSLLAQYLPAGSGEKLDEWARRLAQMPSRNTTALVGLSTVVFYLAERGRNPKVNDVWDALMYCSTCISVGYGDIFAKTPIGKVLGSALMTVGPAMAAKMVDGPHRHQQRDQTQEEILETLRRILAKLEGRSGEGEDAVTDSDRAG